jgi:transposase
VPRDRNGGYAGAVSRALPEALQVADRWHLLENASAAFLAAVRRQMPAIHRAVGATVLDPGLLTAAERLQYEGFQRRKQINRMVRHMADEGIPIKRIVRTTGFSRGLIRRIIRGEREDVFRVRQNSLTPWLPLLERQWAAGCRNGAQLWRRLRAAGFGGSLRVVGEWATRQRRVETAGPSGSGMCLPARRIAQFMTSARQHLSKAEAVLVARIEAALLDATLVVQLHERARRPGNTNVQVRLRSPGSHWDPRDFVKAAPGTRYFTVTKVAWTSGRIGI